MKTPSISNIVVPGTSEVPATIEVPTNEVPATNEVPTNEVPATNEVPTNEVPTNEFPTTNEVPALIVNSLKIEDPLISLIAEQNFEILKGKLKSFRIDVEGIYQMVKSLKPVKTAVAGSYNVFTESSSVQLVDSENYLLYAKGWAGKLLGEMGEESPYKNDGKRKSVSDIEPTDARHTESPFVHLGSGNYELPNGNKVHIGISDTERVDTLRTQVSELANVIRYIDRDSYFDTREKSTCRTNIWTNLENARMALGFELERVREEAKG